MEIAMDAIESGAKQTLGYAMESGAKQTLG